MSKKKNLNTLLILLFLTPFSLIAATNDAKPESSTPTFATISTGFANFATPDNNSHYNLITYSRLEPYTLFREKPAHELLKRNLEFSIGFAGGEQSGTVASGNVLVHRYLSAPSEGLRPFVEAGIGFIYTEFKIPGQGLHLNFNPKVGIGFERYSSKGLRYFASLRVSHISNGGLNKNNEGITSIVLSLGRDFKF